ncbi:hypothetical protein D9M71_781750 [compost metagenome]
MPHKAVDHRQAKAGALADRLGGEEGLKGALHHCFGHAHAGVFNADTQKLASGQAPLSGFGALHFDIGATDAQGAAKRHGVTGVDAQVEQRVFQLLCVYSDRP